MDRTRLYVADLIAQLRQARVCGTDLPARVHEEPGVKRPEVDGLRIIGESAHEFLHAVPEVVEKIFQFGFSEYPGQFVTCPCKSSYSVYRSRDCSDCSFKNGYFLTRLYRRNPLYGASGLRTKRSHG